MIGREELRAVRAVIEPDAEPHIGIAEDRGRNHLRGRIAEQDGVETVRDTDADGGSRLVAGRTRPVVAPIGHSAGSINESELELAGAVEVRGADDDAALVVDDLRDLSAERADAKTA